MVKCWHEETGDYRVECLLRMLQLFSSAIPEVERSRAYVLTGDFIMDGVIGFSLPDAVPVEEALTDEELKQYQVVQHVRFPLRKRI